MALIVGGYAIYVFTAYYRLPAKLSLKPTHNQTKVLHPGKTYTAMTYNIGYGSYPPNYSFFMDGGRYSVAFSKKAVLKSLAGVIKTTQQVHPDIAFYQEVDVDGDRSRHVNEVAHVKQQFPTYSALFGQNYDSPYLFYPLTHPIGKAKSGLLTLSKFRMAAATRYRLPVPKGFGKLIDLDRAFTAVQLPVSNGRHLTVINIHMSAFTSDRRVQQAQFHKLFHYITTEYQKHNYVLVAGDYNHTILKDSANVFHTTQAEMTWTHPFPDSELPTGFYRPTMNLAKAAVPSARALDQPYHPGKSFVTMIDGYILSNNIQAKAVSVVNTGFAFSDHNPVRMEFVLE